MSELQEARWYVVHTYSGHENKVKATIEKAVKTRGMEDYITHLVVPTEDVVETTKTGKEKTRQRKVFPSYVLVKMIITDESWYIVRNTKGVTGFVGPGSKPVPLSDEEIGDAVEVAKGPFSGQVGTVEEINLETREAKVCIDAFGKKTLFVIEFENIQKI